MVPRAASKWLGLLAHTRHASNLQSMKYERGQLQILDQLLLPHTTEFKDVKGSEDAFHVIRDMNVRGAPLIAMVAALGLAVEVQGMRGQFTTSESAAAFMCERLDYYCE